MQIDGLPLLTRALQSGDDFALDDGNAVTYRMKLLDAINTLIAQSIANANLTIISFSVSDLSDSKTIVDMGLVSNGASYIVVLSRMQGTAQDIASIYTVRIVNNTFYRQSTIHEGTYSSAPILQSDGTITKKSGAAFATGDSYRGIALRFGA